MKKIIVIIYTVIILYIPNTHETQAVHELASPFAEFNRGFFNTLDLKHHGYNEHFLRSCIRAGYYNC